MGKLNEFKIILDNPKAVYNPEETITGKLNVSLSEPMEMDGITVACIGKAKCQWTELGDDSSRAICKFHYGYERLMDIVLDLYGDELRTVEHPAGDFVYPFSFTFPEALPTATEEKHGYIRYYIKGKITKPRKSNHVIKLPLMIAQVIDTNNPIYQQPEIEESCKQVGFWCCRNGKVSISVEINRSAFCPGETILITAECYNASTRTIRKSKAKLVRIVKYNSNDEEKKSKKVLSKVEATMSCTGNILRWDNQPLTVPQTKQSILNSYVIDIYYYLLVEVVIPRALNLEVRLPIIIGTVPFGDTQGQQESPFLALEQSSTTDNFNITPTAPSFMIADEQPEMPPPSYDQAILLETSTNKEKEEEDDDHKGHNRRSKGYTAI